MSTALIPMLIASLGGCKVVIQEADRIVVQCSSGHKAITLYGQLLAEGLHVRLRKGLQSSAFYIQATVDTSLLQISMPTVQKCFNTRECTK